MADTVVTLRPNGTVDANGWTASATTLHGDTSDDSDATYITTPTLDKIGRLDLGTATIPALAVIKGVGVRVRASDIGLLQQIAGLITDDGAVVFDRTPAMSGTIVTYTLPKKAASPGGRPWTQALIDSLQVAVANDTFSAAKVYELYVDVTYNQAPTATAPAVSSTATSKPTVSWTYGDPEGDPQERYRVKVFAQVQSTPDSPTAAPIWDSGEVISAATAAAVTTPLTDRQDYYAYVKVADRGSAGRYGAWSAAVTWTASFTPPGTPVVTATPDAANGRVQVILQGRTNALTVNQSSLETDTTGWAAQANCAISRSTGASLAGSASLLMTSSAAGDMNAATSTARTAMDPGQRWSARAWFRAQTQQRQVRVALRFYDVGNNFLSQVLGTSVGEPAGPDWAQATVSAVVPALATRGDVLVQVIGTGGAGEEHFVDQVEISPGVANLLSVEQASIEDVSLSGWQADLNCGLARSALRSLTGSASLLMMAVADGDMNASSAPTLAAVSAGAVYTASLAVSPQSAQRQVRCVLRWYTAANAFIDQVVGTAVGQPQGPHFTRVSATGTAPAGATQADVLVQVFSAVAGEQHYVDDASLVADTDFAMSPDWTLGGMVPTQVIALERSDDGGVTWTAVRQGDAYGFLNAPQQFFVYDYEAPFGAAVYYRAKATAVPVDAVSSPYSALAAATVVSDTDWLKDPLDPAANMRLCLEAPGTSTSDERQVISEPLDRVAYFVQGDVVRGEVFQVAFSVVTDAEWAAFEALRRSQAVLLLQTQWGDGTGAFEQFYVRLGPTRSVTRVSRGDYSGRQLRMVSVPAREVSAPSV